jgi:hypothetical protein
VKKELMSNHRATETNTTTERRKGHPAMERQRYDPQLNIIPRCQLGQPKAGSHYRDNMSHMRFSMSVTNISQIGLFA